VAKISRWNANTNETEILIEDTFESVRGLHFDANQQIFYAITSNPSQIFSCNLQSEGTL
jgi:hypothetical protein